MVDYYTDVTPAVARMHQNADGASAPASPSRCARRPRSQGAEFMFDTQVTRLLTNADGEVEGVSSQMAARSSASRRVWASS